MLELIVGAIAGLIAVLGGKLWWANRKAGKLEEKIAANTLAELAHVEKAKLNLDAAKKSAGPIKPDQWRRDFEGD